MLLPFCQQPILSGTNQHLGASLRIAGLNKQLIHIGFSVTYTHYPRLRTALLNLGNRLITVQPLPAFLLFYRQCMTAGALTEEGKQRLSIMRETNDGFRIAETDLRLRGPGEFFGTRQSGLPAFRIADLLRDAEIIELARREARAFTQNPPSREDLVELVTYVREHWSRRYGLVQVG